MAESSEELNFVIRMLFPDAKLPPIDTSEAQAAIAKLQSLAKAAQSEVAGSMATMASAVGAPAVAAAGRAGGVGGTAAPIPGYPAPSGGWGFGAGQTAPFTMAWDPKAKQTVFTYPQGSPYAPPSPPPTPSSGHGYAAGPGFAPAGSGVRWANNAPGPGNWSLGNGNWAQGPVSDPGSWAAASQSSSAGYSSAMAPAFDASTLDTYAQGLQKLRLGMSQVRESTTGLAASVILLNKSFQEGSGFDNWYTQAIGGLGALSHGANLIHGGGRVLQGGAAIGGRFAAGLGATGLASQLGGLAGMSGLGLTALTAIPAAATAGAFYFAPGGFRDTWAEQARQDSIGAGLDTRLSAIHAERDARSSQVTSTSHWASRFWSDQSAIHMSKFSAGAITASQVQAGNARSLHGLGINASALQSVVDDEGTSLRKRLDANRELAANLRQQQDYHKQNAELTRQETVNREQLLRVTQQQTEAVRNTAHSAAESFGRLSNRDLARRDRLVGQAQREGLNWRTAIEIERFGGATGETRNWLRARGQAEIDAIPAGFRPEGARSTPQIQQLEAQIKKLEENHAGMTERIGSAFETMDRNVSRIGSRIIAVEKKQTALEQRLSY